MFLPFSIEDSVLISWAHGFSFSGLPPDCIRHSLRPAHFQVPDFGLMPDPPGVPFNNTHLQGLGIEPVPGCKRYVDHRPPHTTMAHPWDDTGHPDTPIDY